MDLRGWGHSVESTTVPVQPEPDGDLPRDYAVLALRAEPLPPAFTLGTQEVLCVRVYT